MLGLKPRDLGHQLWDGTKEFAFQTCDADAIGFRTSLEGQLLQGDPLYYETDMY